MKLPSRIVDISSPLENETVYDPPFMRPKIEYLSHKDTAPMICEIFPGLRPEDLPDGEGWAYEHVELKTHNGTHMDAPMHFQSKSIDGKRMIAIDEVPLDWFFRPAVKLDFRKLPDGHVVSAAEVEAELKCIGHELKPFDIVLVNTRASACVGTEEYLSAGIGMGREATLISPARRARDRHRCLGLGRRSFIRASAGLDARPENHLGRPQGRPGIPYCHMEKLYNLEQLPPHGFTVACFPTRLKAHPAAGPARWRCSIEGRGDLLHVRKSPGRPFGR